MDNKVIPFNANADRCLFCDTILVVGKDYGEDVCCCVSIPLIEMRKRQDALDKSIGDLHKAISLLTERTSQLVDSAEKLEGPY